MNVIMAANGVSSNVSTRLTGDASPASSLMLMIGVVVVMLLLVLLVRRLLWGGRR